jgi:oligopeptide transport system ATP-binding protein
VTGHAPVLDVRDLRVEYTSSRGTVHAVNGVSFAIGAGEVLAVVGESGSGKSATALAVMGLTPRAAGHIAGGEVLFNGTDLLSLDEKRLRSIRGKEIAMIFQNPMTTLNPLMTVGSQLCEVLRRHLALGKADAHRRAVELLTQVNIAEPETRLRAYPHQLSGGQRQRMMIAMALSCEPALVIADEATTALDVTTQAQILRLLRRVATQTETAMIVITHSMGVVADIADRVAVMYAGRLLEVGAVRDTFHAAQHPYTIGLLGSIPRMNQPRSVELPTIGGRPPSLLELPAGCSFHDRCALAHDRCATETPVLRATGPGSTQLAACWAAPGSVDRLRQLSSPRIGTGVRP